MKDEILKIINGPIQTEPIYLLEFEYRKLKELEGKNKFLDIISEIAIGGSKKEKFACLTIIEMLGKANENEEVVKINIDKLDAINDELLIPPLLTLCAIISKKWSIDFIKKIMIEFKPVKKEYVYLYDISITSMVSSSFWLESIKEINWVLSSYDDRYIVDFIAYFKWKRNDDDFSKLKTNLIEENLKTISILQSDIDNRYKNHYMILK